MGSGRNLEFFVELRVDDAWMCADDVVVPRYPILYCLNCDGRLIECDWCNGTPRHIHWEPPRGSGKYHLPWSGPHFCSDGENYALPEERVRHVPWLADPDPEVFEVLAAVAPPRGLPADLSQEVWQAVPRHGSVRASHLTVRTLLGHPWAESVHRDLVHVMLRMARLAGDELESVRCVFWVDDHGS
ncbi:hypothetical protein [Actinomadura macrotermitis]|uniref:Uncharacterized protein n=1 Tax=Actinomadura macrotermitis TaxID=2585200 RepID=A0A7K0BXD8_9ACTN|nr:hypothetical protein [Actinomadura macrotermitis]MQY05848.1 hypothetical protein [Actinomadura macrotermitis]